MQNLLGVKKRYTFLPPFDAYNTDLEITLVGLPDIGALISGLVDVFELVYKPVGLTQTDLENDIRNDKKLMTFRTTSSDYLQIPEGYLANDVTVGVKMVNKALIFNLGAVLSDEDFVNSSLASDCASLITSVTGIIPTHAYVDISGVTHIDSASVSAYLSKRVLSKNTEDNSYYTKWLKLKELIIEKDQRIAALEQSILP